MIRPHWRTWPILLIAGAFGLHWQWQRGNPGPDAAQGATGSPSRVQMPVLTSTANQDTLRPAVRDPFSPVPAEPPAQPPPVKTVTAPPPSPAPPPPPLTWRFFGAMGQAGELSVFLARGESVVRAEPGLALDGDFVVQSVEPARVVITHPPSGTRYEMPIPEPAGGN